MLLGLMKTARACGDGSSMSISAGTTYSCCSVNHDAIGYTYTVDGGTHDDNIKFTVENDEGTVYLDTDGECDITSSGTSCSGNACSSANNNNCYREVTSGIEAQKICIKMDCENWSASCDVDAWTVDFNYASPPPPSPSPPPPPPIPHFRIASESCEETLLGWACDSSGWLAGRLEVKLTEYDSWGTICDDGFTDTEADLACKQMGYDYGVMLSSTTTVDGDLLQTIALDEFSCPSNATSIDACVYSTTHDCSHSEDIGVDCYKSSPTFRIAPNSCTSGSCSSTSMSEGRLEVSFSDGSVWGTVCDDFFDDNAADTICREMGFSSGTMLDSVYDGDFSLTILMDDINCPAGSASFSSCSYEGAHDCSHFEDVGVSCIVSSSPSPPPPPPIPHFRIASESCEETLLGWACDSSGWLAGRLEVKLTEYDSWGTICDDGFTDTEADLACKQMGYDYGVMLSSTTTVDGDLLQTIALDEFSCPSNATSIDACVYSTTHDCSHSEDIGVDCYKSSPTFRIAPNSCTSGSCSSTSMSEGRLEVSFSDGSVWGTVCDDFFDDNAADTICREMGFSSGTMLDSVYDGDFSLTILMDDINCPAGSASFSSCSYEGAHDCSHFEDVGVSCIVSSSTGTTPTPPPTPPQATFCYGRWSDDLFTGTDMDYMANGETQVRGCDYSGESCDSYTFSYELVDNNGYDDIDIMITDGADCEASTSSELAAVAHYTAYRQDDVYSAMVYDHIINPTLDSDKFCIYVTCDNHVFGCDDISLKIKMSCNLDSSSTTTRTDSSTTTKTSPASWTRPITSRIILFAAGIAAFLAY